jgi:hypothetical protein
MCAVLVAGWALRTDGAPLPDDAPTYLLVLDRSGSMTLKDDQPTSRWQRLQELTADFIGRRPLGARIILVVFDPNPQDASPIKILAEVVLDSEATRESLRQRILSSADWPAGLGQPTNGKTPLYYSIKLALERAIEESLDGKRRPIAIRVYTDGKDEYEVPNPVTEAQLCKLCEKLEALNSNSRKVFVKIGNEQFDEPAKKCCKWEDQPFERAIPLAIRERNINLVSPIVEVRQDIQLTIVESSDADLALLKNQKLAVDFVPESGDPIQARVEGSLSPQSGPQKVTIEVTNRDQLRGDQEYGGELEITPPAVRGYRIDGLADNPKVRFQKAEPPQISGVQPADGTLVLMGRPVVFRVDTLQDATVDWEFGDASPRVKGHVAIHKFEQAGSPTARVTVTDRYKQSATAEVHLKVVDAGVLAVAPVEKVFERVPCELTCTTWGGVAELKWRVSGEAELLAASASGGKSALSYKFAEPGRHFARPQARLTDMIVGGDEIAIDVQPLEAALHSDSTSTRYKQRFEVKLFTEAPVEKVVWDFGDPRARRVAESIQGAIYEFHSFGSMPVQAELTLAGGETFKSPKLFVNVVRQPPVAKGDVMYGGVSAASVRRVLPGAVVELKDECAGDLDRIAWEIVRPGGKSEPLPENATSVSLKDPGYYTMTLRAIGPNEEGEKEKSEDKVSFTLAVRPRALHELTWGAGTLMLAALGVAMWRSIRNAPATWSLAVGEDLSKLTDEDYGEPLARYWRKMSKTGRLPLAHFVAHEYFKTDAGGKEALEVSRIRSQGVRGALKLNVHDGNERLSGVRQSVDYRIYELDIPEVSEATSGEAAGSGDTAAKTTYLKLLTVFRLRWDDIIFFVVALLLCVAVVAAVYLAVEKWSGRI